MTTTLTNTLNTEGINFSATYTPYDQTAVSSSTNSPDNPGPPFTVGTQAFGTLGSKWIFVKAASAITISQVVGVDQTTSFAAPLTKAMADAARLIGIAPTAIGSGVYGWIQLTGAGSATLKNACLPNVPLYTTASAGMLDDTSASQTRVYGIRSQVTATSSGSIKLCWIEGVVV